MNYPVKHTVSFISLLIAITVFAAAQDQGSGFSGRGSIPEELLRPKRGEAPRYPIDTVIGELGRGEAPADAYSYANLLAAGLTSANMSHPALAAINVSLRENFLSLIGKIEGGSFRLGGGKREPDGSVSFLIRFIGRELGITGELFLRYVSRQTEEDVDGETRITTTGNWTFEDLILEEAKTRDEEKRESQRFDFSPYERFF